MTLTFLRLDSNIESKNPKIIFGLNSYFRLALFAGGMKFATQYSPLLKFSLLIMKVNKTLTYNFFCLFLF